MSYAELADFKTHARIDFDDDDALLQSYLDAATEYVRGFLADDPEADSPPSEIPDDVKQATMLIASAWYETRESTAPDTLREIPFGARDLLNQVRGWTFG
jgi:uncharacterized phage protein (predicted DNA packaging)